MGFYIDPPDEDKESFLSREGKPITETAAKAFAFTGDSLPVCLVDNGPFTAAGIAIDARERDHFARDTDPRPRQWYIVPKAKLSPYYQEP